MKTHTTNYYQTFIEVAEDCKVKSGTVPPTKENKQTIAELQFKKLIEKPYQFNSDEVIFSSHPERNNLSESDATNLKESFFSKGQACFRASPLTKSYGWGVHFNEEGKMALYGVESEEYQNYLKDESIKKVKAMKSKK